MLDGLVLRAHDRSCRAIGRSTTDWRARSAGNWLCRRRKVLADYLRPNRSSWSLRIRGHGDFESFPAISASDAAPRCASTSGTCSSFVPGSRFP